LLADSIINSLTQISQARFEKANDDNTKNNQAIDNFNQRISATTESLQEVQKQLQENNDKVGIKEKQLKELCQPQ
jgi:predicted  nucleic acid-binding Zn-ribbon protein